MHSYQKGNTVVTEFLPQDMNLIKWDDYEPTSWKATVNLIDCSLTVCVPYAWVRHSNQTNRDWTQDKTYLCYYTMKPRKSKRPNFDVIFTKYLNANEARLYNVKLLMLSAVKSE